VDSSEQRVTVETVMWCRSYFWFTLVKQVGQLNKIGSHTIKYFIVTSTDNLILVQFTSYCKRFYVLIVKIKVIVLYYMMPWTDTKIHEENPTICNNVSKFYYSNLHKTQHVSGDTPPIIRSLKLHWQPLVFHTWKAVGRVVSGRCLAQCA
jgi:hypothetical protein